MLTKTIIPQFDTFIDKYVSFTVGETPKGCIVFFGSQKGRIAGFNYPLASDSLPLFQILNLEYPEVLSLKFLPSKNLLVFLSNGKVAVYSPEGAKEVQQSTKQAKAIVLKKNFVDEAQQATKRFSVELGDAQRRLDIALLEAKIENEKRIKELRTEWEQEIQSQVTQISQLTSAKAESEEKAIA